MFSFLRRLFSVRLSSMNTAFISKKNILQNLDLLQSLQKNSVIFPILKSNAYGHWILQMTKILSKTDVPYIVVDSYPEYQIVKKYSNKQILVIWETLPDNYKKFDLKRTAFAVYNIPTLAALWRLKKKVRIHVFLNTAMNREWVWPTQLDAFLQECLKYKNIEIEWVMSHLYWADYHEKLSDIDQEVVWKKWSIDQQVDIFKKMYYQILEHGFAPIWRHIGNSAAIFQMKEDFFNAWRPGLALYGYSPFEEEHPAYKSSQKLIPALSIKSRIVSLHEVWPGDGVGYGHKYIPEHREIIGTVPFGYAEWLPRSASQKISFRANKKVLPQVGTICMNLSSFLANDKLKIWDEIELISNDPKKENSLIELAKASDRIIYECLIGFDKWMRREII